MHLISDLTDTQRKFLAGFLGLCALIIVVCSRGCFSSGAESGIPPRGPVDFVDEETGETSIRPADDIPPLIGSRGKPTLVRAIYDWGPDKTRVLQCYQKYTPEAKAIVERIIRRKNITADEMRAAQAGCLVRRPESGAPWVPRFSAEGEKIDPHRE